MRKLKIYVDKYGPEVGPRLYHILQSQAAHASVGARLRKKLEAIRDRSARPLPLFDERPAAVEAVGPRAESLNPSAGLLAPPHGR